MPAGGPQPNPILFDTHALPHNQRITCTRCQVHSLIWTALTLSRPCGTGCCQFSGVLTQTPKPLVFVASRWKTPRAAAIYPKTQISCRIRRSWAYSPILFLVPDSSTKVRSSYKATNPCSERRVPKPRWGNSYPIPAFCIGAEELFPLPLAKTGYTRMVRVP